MKQHKFVIAGLAILAGVVLTARATSPPLKGISFSKVEVEGDSAAFASPFLIEELVEAGAELGIEDAPKLTIRLANDYPTHHLVTMVLFANSEDGRRGVGVADDCHGNIQVCANRAMKPVIRMLANDPN